MLIKDEIRKKKKRNKTHQAFIINGTVLRPLLGWLNNVKTIEITRTYFSGHQLVTMLVACFFFYISSVFHLDLETDFLKLMPSAYVQSIISKISSRWQKAYLTYEMYYSAAPNV